MVSTATVLYRMVLIRMNQVYQFREDGRPPVNAAQAMYRGLVRHCVLTFGR